MTDEILTTNGIRSDVYEYGEVCGHVLLVDYDECRPDTMMKEISGFGGVNFLFESSEGSFHFWNLSLRTLEATALEMLSLHGDAAHIPPGYRRGYWVLRTTSKDRPSAEIYKESPTLKKAWFAPTDRPQSLGHFNYAKAKWDVDVEIPSGVEWIGDTYAVDRYLTITDEEKHRLREEQDG